MRPIFTFTIVLIAFVAAERLQAEEKVAPAPKDRETATQAGNRNSDLLDAAQGKIALIRSNPAPILLPSDRSACLQLAADLAELGGSDKDGKHLRDLAAKDEAPPTLLELLTKRQSQLDALQRQVAYLRQMTHTEQSILVEVRMVEASRSKLAEAGIKVSAYSIKPVTKSDEPAPAVDTSTDVSASHGEHAGDYFKILDDLQLKRIAKIVASPSLITVSGRPAFFHSGGEFPYLQSRPSGDPSVEFKPWGVELNLMAMSMSSEKIRLELKTRLGERDNASSVENHGMTIPGLNVREWDVGLEMKSGETLVVGEVPQCGSAASHLSAVGDESSDVSDTKEAADDMVTLLVVRATLMEPMVETDKAVPGSGYGAIRETRAK